jgi:Tfp pilus assembly protein PilN
MQDINLVEARLLPPLRVVSGLRLATMAVAGALLVLGHWGFERFALARAMAAANATEAPDTSASNAGGNDGLGELRERVAQREALRDLLAADHLPQHPAVLLRAVVEALPGSVWLTEIDIARERALRISGGALDVAALDPFTERLAQVALLRGVPISTLRLEPSQAEGEARERQHALRSWQFTLASGAAAVPGER